MKKVLVFLLLLALLMTSLVPMVSMAETYKWVKVNKGTTVNVREGPGKEYKKVTTLNYGTKVLVYETVNGWSLCEPIDSHTMWSNPMYIQSSFLVSSDPGTKKQESGETTSSDWNAVAKASKALVCVDDPYEGVVKTKKPGNAVHVRWFPDTNAPFSQCIYAGEEIEILATSKTWTQIRVVETGKVGFILTSCVDADSI